MKLMDRFLGKWFRLQSECQALRCHRARRNFRARAQGVACKAIVNAICSWSVCGPAAGVKSLSRRRKKVLSVTLHEVVERLGLVESTAVLEPGWDDGQQSAPDDGLPFLEPPYVTWACGVACLSDEITSVAVEAAHRVQSDEALRGLAWHCHHSLSAPQETIVQWPIPVQAMGDLAGLFYVLVLLARTEQMQEAHRARGIPAEIVRETVADLAHLLTTGDYYAEHGHCGLLPRNLDWLKHHWNGTLYQLGRLQYYTQSKSQGRLRAFRHRASARVLALAEDGIRFRTDGQMDGAAGVHDGAAWTSALREHADGVAGNPIHPKGHAVEEEVHLPRTDWEEVLSPASDVLAIHIPSGSSLDFDACGASLDRARRFFPRHFPKKAFAAFTCHSWLLDTTFDDLLGPSSNMVRFQREMYLYPRVYRRPRVVEEAIFGRPLPPLDAVPRETRLQRAVAEHIEAGGRMHGGGGCFMLLDNLDWGSQRYRRQDWPWQDLDRGTGVLRPARDAGRS